MVTLTELLDDPEPFIGREVEVLGKVFFLSECPPPGSGGPAASGSSGCVLLGYLADPELGAFTAADAARAIPIAEAGRRLSCAEGATPPGCGDWRPATRYRVVGVPTYQVLGGRETTLVQLDVVGKTEQ